MNRLEKQKLRQREYRQRMKMAKAPSRDDIARTVLHWMITNALEKGRSAQLGKIQSIIVDRLAEQGFDHRVSDIAFEALVERYSDGWSFQHKLHLRAAAGDEGDGED